MTDKELKKLTRAQLLEIMLEQSKEIDRLTEELETVRKELAGRELKISKTGSLAEASAAVNSFMETAQATADQYLENIRRICGEKAAAAGKTEEWNRALKEIEGTAEEAAETGAPEEAVETAEPEAAEEAAESGTSEEIADGAGAEAADAGAPEEVVEAEETEGSEND